MTERTIEWAGTPNYRQGRNGRQPVAIVNHITAGAFPGCLTWMQNPAAEASAHYLVTKAGRVIQMVKEEDAAWHAGGVNKPDWPLYDGTNPNQYTIGIEHEGQPTEPLTAPQYQSTLWLHRQIIAKWRIPIDRDHIIGHYRIDSVNRPNCPGAGFPWDRLFNDLKGGAIMDTIRINIGDKSFVGQREGDNPVTGPVRAMLEALGCTVTWDEKTKAVFVTPSESKLYAENQRLRQVIKQAGGILAAEMA